MAFFMFCSQIVLLRKGVRSASGTLYSIAQTLKFDNDPIP